MVGCIAINDIRTEQWLCKENRHPKSGLRGGCLTMSFPMDYAGFSGGVL